MLPPGTANTVICHPIWQSLSPQIVNSNHAATCSIPVNPLAQQQLTSRHLFSHWLYLQQKGIPFLHLCAGGIEACHDLSPISEKRHFLRHWLTRKPARGMISYQSESCPITVGIRYSGTKGLVYSISVRFTGSLSVVYFQNSAVVSCVTV